MADMEEVEVVVAHSQRATLRVGDVYLKVDADPAHADRDQGHVPRHTVVCRRRCKSRCGVKDAGLVHRQPRLGLVH